MDYEIDKWAWITIDGASVERVRNVANVLSSNFITVDDHAIIRKVRGKPTYRCRMMVLAEATMNEEEE